MCGFVGVITGKENSYDLREVIGEMADEIKHRGPDFSGIYCEKDISLYLAHQRLSILDLSEAGNQPMQSYRSRFVIAFNGEIYNHNYLKRKLDSEIKLSWKGTSDTEILVNSIDFWGLNKTLELAKGMFAFSLLDKIENKLFLVRDRFGEKPLYWSFAGKGSAKALIFGSDIKALKQFPSFDSTINLNALDAFLKFSCIPSELTIFKSVKKLKPGHIIEFDLEKDYLENQPKSNKWWDYEKTIERARVKEFKSKEEAIKHLELALNKSVKSQSIADVSLGCFLSGGIDSSLIVSLLSKQNIAKINTFTIGFDDKNYDESKASLEVANYLGTNHTEIFLNPEDALNIIPQLPLIYSEPFSDPSQIPTALVCREAKKAGLSVALTGDGGDELFGGYVRHFLAPKIWNKLKYIPYPLRILAGSLIRSIPTNQLENFKLLSSQSLLSQKINKISHRLKNINSSDSLYRSLIQQRFDDSIYNEQLVEYLKVSSTEYFPELKKSPECLSNDPSGRMMYWDALGYLPDDILVKVDRASMAYSLETRAPFLDHSIAEIAWRIPTNMKVRGGQGKLILKELLMKYLPRKFVERPKSGFGFPVKEWLRGPLIEWSEDLLNNENLNKNNHLSSFNVKKLWHDHITSKADNTNLLWSILMWQSWLKHYKV